MNVKNFKQRHGYWEERIFYWEKHNPHYHAYIEKGSPALEKTN